MRILLLFVLCVASPAVVARDAYVIVQKNWGQGHSAVHTSHILELHEDIAGPRLLQLAEIPGQSWNYTASTELFLAAMTTNLSSQLWQYQPTSVAPLSLYQSRRNFAALAPFSAREMVGYRTSVANPLGHGLTLISEHGESRLCSRRSLPGALYDMAIARISATDLLVFGNADPVPGTNRKNTFELIQLRIVAPGKCDVVFSTKVPHVHSGYRTLLHATGAYYVEQDKLSGVLRMAHAPLPGAANHNLVLAAVQRKAGHTLVPISVLSLHSNAASAPDVLLFRGDDDLWEIPLGATGQPRVRGADFFGRKAIDLATPTKAKMPFPFSFASVRFAPAQTEPFWATSYAAIPKRSRRSAVSKATIRSVLVGLWSLAFGQAQLPPIVVAGDLARLLETQPSASLWLHEALLELGPAQYEPHGLRHDGRGWSAPTYGKPVDVDALLALVEGTPRCAGLFATP